MSYRILLSHTTIKPLALTILTSLVLLGCQPKSNNTDSSASGDNAASVTKTTSQTTTQSTVNASKIEATQPTASATTIIEQPITILALGDSLTEGLGVPENDAYPAQLEAALKQAGYVNAKVINSGLSGETSTGLVNRLDWALKTKPDVTILTIGANDAMRGIDVATIEQNMRTAIERLQGEGIIVVLGGMQIYDNLGDEYVKAFSNIYPKLAKEYDVAFIPFFLEGVGGEQSLNQADAIHPTKEGYTNIVNNNIMPVLKPTVEQFIKASPKAAVEIAQ